MEGNAGSGVGGGNLSQAGWGHVELERKGVQDVVVFLGFVWGQGCECQNRFVWRLPCGIWSRLGWNGELVKPGQGSSEERTGVAEHAESVLQGVVCLLGPAVVRCLGGALVGEELWLLGAGAQVRCGLGGVAVWG